MFTLLEKVFLAQMNRLLRSSRKLSRQLKEYGLDLNIQAYDAAYDNSYRYWKAF